MKMFLVLLSVIVSSTALATSKKRADRFRTSFTQLSVSQVDGNPLPQAASGYLIVNRSRKLITLNLRPPGIKCPPRAMCMPPRPYIEELRVVGKELTDRSCNISTTVAMNDNTSDGSTHIMEIRDNTTNTCPTLVALVPVEVTYTFKSSTGEEAISLFKGTRFTREP